MAKFYANPYDTSKTGFYFDGSDDFDKKAAKQPHVEEYEIEFIDGSDEEADVFNLLLKDGIIHQGNLDKIDDIEALGDSDKAALYWAYSMGTNDDLDETLAKVEDALRAGQMTMKEYVYELLDDIGLEGFNNPEFYFDYESFGRDLAIDADMSNQELGEHYVHEVLGGFEALDKKTKENYVDVDAIARDMDMGGDADEFSFGGNTWVMTTPHEL